MRSGIGETRLRSSAAEARRLRGQAQAEVDVLIPQLMAAHKEWWGNYTSTVTELKDFVSG